MSAYFNDPEDADRFERHARENASTGPALGAWQQAGLGLARGGAQTADAARMALAVPVIAFGDDEAQDAYFAATDTVIKSALDRWTPDPESTTFAGRVLGGVTEAILPLMAGGGSPAVLMASAQTRTSRALVDQGVDASLAVDAGVIDAFAIGAGFMIPALGNSIARKIAFGAASNPLLGGAAVGIQSAALREGGYADVAKNYDAFDLESRAIDSILGAAFGGIAGAVKAKAPELGLDRAGQVSVETIDAALAYRGAQRWASRGLGTSLAAKNAHDANMRMAMEQTIRGDPVSVRAYEGIDPPVMSEADAKAIGEQIARDVFDAPVLPKVMPVTAPRAEPAPAIEARTSAEVLARDADGLPTRLQVTDAGKSSIIDIQGRDAEGRIAKFSTDEPATPKEKPAGDDIDLELLAPARDLARDDMPYMDVDDLTETTSVQALADADRAIVEAETTYARAVQAAANCLLI